MSWRSVGPAVTRAPSLPLLPMGIDKGPTYDAEVNGQGFMRLRSVNTDASLSNELSAHEVRLDDSATGDSEVTGVFLVSWGRRPAVNHRYDSGDRTAPMLFSPNAKVVWAWHMLVFFAVMWSLLVTPFQMGESSDELAAWTLASYPDAAAHVLFYADLLMHFNIAFNSQGDDDGDRLVLDRRAVAWRYLVGPFCMDLVCAVPWVNFGIPILRLVRVFKLRRVLRALRLEKSHFFLMFFRHYRVVMLVRCLVVIFFCSHLISCLWVGLAVSTEHLTWMDALVETKTNLSPHITSDVWSLYLWSMYYSITLVTTVGFGDVTPQTNLECVVCIFCMCVGTLVWAYMLAMVCDAVSNADGHRVEFETQMDELKVMMDEYELRGSLQHNVLQYFQSRQELMKNDNRRHFFEKMSAELRGRVTVALWERSIRGISFLNRMFEEKNGLQIRGSIAFVREMCQLFQMQVCAPGENLNKDNLTIVQRGVVVKGAVVKPSGSIFGEDCYVVNPLNRSRAPAMALTNTSLLVAPQPLLVKLLRLYPAQKKLIRKHSNWKALRQGVIRVMRSIVVAQIAAEEEAAEAEFAAEKGCPRASVGDSTARRGYYAKSSMLQRLSMDLDEEPRKRSRADTSLSRCSESSVRNTTNWKFTASTDNLDAPEPLAPTGDVAKLLAELLAGQQAQTSAIDKMQASLDEVKAGQNVLEARMLKLEGPPTPRILIETELTSERSVVSRAAILDD